MRFKGGSRSVSLKYLVIRLFFAFACFAFLCLFCLPLPVFFLPLPVLPSFACFFLPLPVLPLSSEVCFSRRLNGNFTPIRLAYRLCFHKR